MTPIARPDQRDGIDPYPSAVTVEFLHTEGCPNAVECLLRLRRLLAAAGLIQPLQVRAIRSPEQAVHERFLGSPTIRINGRDIDRSAAHRRDFGLSCRLYTSSDGLRGVPPDEWVLAELHRTVSDWRRDRTSVPVWHLARQDVCGGGATDHRTTPAVTTPAPTPRP